MKDERKLTPAAVRYIRRCRQIRDATPSGRALSIRYNVCEATIRQIQLGKRYKDVQ